MQHNDGDWVTLNGVRMRFSSGAHRLVDWLRDDMGLTGTKLACGTGDCGACSVLLNDQVMLSCCTLVATVAQQEVVTVEGIAKSNPNDPLFQAFVSHDAVQCGYCTPGMIVTARAFLNAAHAGDPRTLPFDEASVRRMLAGNVCRCTGYVQIVAAVLEAARVEGCIS
jgi:aerobic-type carbon monoxide dehydrogenase small subunit (CoxS/CutS family)